MSCSFTNAPALHDHLRSLSMRAPDVHDRLAVFPLFGPPPRLEYVSFAQGRAAGVSIKELEDRASVNDLLVINPTGTAVLLYEGEEVLGAQQNRTFDVSVLVGAGTRLHVPVSCVEAGRWDGSRHDEAFDAAPQTAYPSLRRMKNTASRASMAAGMAARADQGAVWNELARKSARLAVASATGAMGDIYDDRRERLDEFRRAMVLHEGQTGALVLVGGRPVVLDHVSRPEVFAALHGPLVQGYALDALEASGGPDPSDAVAEGFLSRVLGARVSEHDGIGLGRDLRFAEGAVAGAGLLAGDELVQLTAFPDEPAAGGEPRARIRRPSRRRPG
ncbi:MAG TPA: DUF6569 family protein [Solirubrobacteraceae bacterium]|nr:DUF6569 family protein [Solirubrobacteraceae bacterium]